MQWVCVCVPNLKLLSSAAPPPLVTPTPRAVTCSAAPRLPGCAQERRLCSPTTLGEPRPLLGLPLPLPLPLPSPPPPWMSLGPCFGLPLPPFTRLHPPTTSSAGQPDLCNPFGAPPPSRASPQSAESAPRFTANFGALLFPCISARTLLACHAMDVLHRSGWPFGVVLPPFLPSFT